MKSGSKKVVIAAGGTGGHLFPAQALARDLQEKHPETQTLFIAKGLSGSAFFDRDLFSYIDVESMSPSIKRPFTSLWMLSKGVFQAFFHLKKEKPSLVLGFGSFHSFPVLIAARLRGIPIALFESNSIPGKVNRIFAKKALFSALYFPTAAKHLKGKSIEVHMPLWHEPKPEESAKEKALEYFSLQDGKVTFLALGGSQGAISINKALLEAFAFLKDKDQEFQVIHLAGKKASIEDIQESYKKLGIPASVKSFEHKMHLAFSLCDVAICRAGSATLSELLLFEVPAILIPYPHAAEKHQHHNAYFMAEMGGAVVFEETQDSSERLAALMTPFLEKEGDLLKVKKRAISYYKETKKAQELTDLVMKEVQGGRDL